ncbi:hypothetical protein THAOC_20991 [Thalassiosira oceanica]|uniref:Uncharacterized protein n=1 Tax=Thalassiosira oceanica TaxID=159749 RepID=K0S0J6_THAOC|nr:hypothetical protein THAOC_20991 [Thalassiosira oceanica]|eukprot:EJK58850.1 hypothetical protein THAOC_20991 [Thalassiosira oceanica]
MSHKAKKQQHAERSRVSGAESSHESRHFRLSLHSILNELLGFDSLLSSFIHGLGLGALFRCAQAHLAACSFSRPSRAPLSRLSVGKLIAPSFPSARQLPYNIDDQTKILKAEVLVERAYASLVASLCWLCVLRNVLDICTLVEYLIREGTRDGTAATGASSAFDSALLSTLGAVHTPFQASLPVEGKRASVLSTLPRAVSRGERTGVALAFWALLALVPRMSGARASPVVSDRDRFRPYPRGSHGRLDVPSFPPPPLPHDKDTPRRPSTDRRRGL